MDRDLKESRIVTDLRALFLEMYGIRINYNLPRELDDIIDRSYRELEEAILKALPPLILTGDVKCKLEELDETYHWMVKPYPGIVLFGKIKPTMSHYVWESDISCNEPWVRDIPLRVDRLVNIREFLEHKEEQGRVEPPTEDCIDGE